MKSSKKFLKSTGQLENIITEISTYKDSKIDHKEHFGDLILESYEVNNKTIIDVLRYNFSSRFYVAYC